MNTNYIILACLFLALHVDAVDASVSKASNQSKLYFALLSDDVQLAKQAIQAGADINAYDENGNLILVIAARHNKNKLVELLLEYGADIYKNNIFGQNAFTILNQSDPNGSWKKFIKSPKVGIVHDILLPVWDQSLVPAPIAIEEAIQPHNVPRGYCMPIFLTIASCAVVASLIWISKHYRKHVVYSDDGLGVDRQV